jgi:pimeloyl-ACP methyl ester carboxylesterase
MSRRSAKIVALAALLLGAACFRAAAEPPAQVAPPRAVRLDFPTGRWVSCLCTADLRQPQPQARTAVIVIHGYRGSGRNNLRWIVDAARLSGKGAETLVLAPQFPSADDKLQPNGHYWSKGGWAAGDLSKDSREPDKRLSSFAVADRLFTELSDAKRFPNLRRIVLVGHSAGGQFVNRYVAVGRLGEGKASPAGQLEYRFLVANPSSYLYLDGRRPVAGTDRFEVPKQKPAGYNMWRYGLENRNAYAAGMTAEEIKTNVSTRTAYYLIGAEDNRQDGNLARGPAAMAEGENRYDRWQKFRRYVALFPERRGHAVFAEVPKAGHSGRQMFTSQAARRAMFE